jgi:hypothetical protein
MRAQRREKGEWRGGVRGAEFSGELDRGFDERFLRRGCLPREAKASAGYARGRRSLEQDGEADDELRWPERANLARRCVGGGRGKLFGLCCCCGEAKGGNGD